MEEGIPPLVGGGRSTAIMDHPPCPGVTTDLCITLTGTCTSVSMPTLLQPGPRSSRTSVVPVPQLFPQRQQDRGADHGLQETEDRARHPSPSTGPKWRGSRASSSSVSTSLRK